jgi:hypothetical protein
VKLGLGKEGISFYFLAKASPATAATPLLSRQESHGDRVPLLMMKK